MAVVKIQKHQLNVDGGTATWGGIEGTLSNQTDLKNALDGKASTNHTHTASEISDLPAVPTKVSDLQNDSGFITDVPVATTATAGKVKPDGTTITVAADGTITAVGGGGSGSVSSVNGQTGVVVLTASDVGAANSSDLTSHINDSDIHVTASDKTTWNGKQSALSTTQLSAANSGITSAKVSGYDTHVSDGDIHVTAAQKAAWTGKQDAISDLATIRSGAAAGATAVQSSQLASVATTGSYNDLSDKPTIPDLTTKADTDLSNVTKPYVTETYVNGTSWYRVYSDGYCEQGGKVTTTSSNPHAVSLLKTMANTNYFVWTSHMDTQGTQQNMRTIKTKGTSSFDFWTCQTSGIEVFWQACGYIS